MVRVLALGATQQAPPEVGRQFALVRASGPLRDGLAARVLTRRPEARNLPDAKKEQRAHTRATCITRQHTAVDTSPCAQTLIHSVSQSVSQ